MFQTDIELRSLFARIPSQASPRSWWRRFLGIAMVTSLLLAGSPTAEAGNLVTMRIGDVLHIFGSPGRDAVKLGYLKLLGPGSSVREYVHMQGVDAYTTVNSNRSELFSMPKMVVVFMGSGPDTLAVENVKLAVLYAWMDSGDDLLSMNNCQIGNAFLNGGARSDEANDLALIYNSTFNSLKMEFWENDIFAAVHLRGATVYGDTSLHYWCSSIDVESCLFAGYCQVGSFEDDNAYLTLRNCTFLGYTSLSVFSGSDNDCYLDVRGSWFLGPRANLSGGFGHDTLRGGPGRGAFFLYFPNLSRFEVYE